ncbi:hypothetical protein CRM22_008266 [Opisthorchis felineus]|uniref:Uncharacterized protein n=1 Tax=Opisthorchis felineus TaxID=147828 RepID=A0A4S2LC27_OPIFE|nr:hypothetical protein CRM22_008266 [Opisthorchis felineus]
MCEQHSLFSYQSALSLHHALKSFVHSIIFLVSTIFYGRKFLESVFAVSCVVSPEKQLNKRCKSIKTSLELHNQDFRVYGLLLRKEDGLEMMNMSEIKAHNHLWITDSGNEKPGRAISQELLFLQMMQEIHALILKKI